MDTAAGTASGTGSTGRRPLIAAAWAAMLMISDLPDIIIDAVGGATPVHIDWYRTLALAVFAGLCLVCKRIRPLGPFALIMLIFHSALAASGWVGGTSWWQAFFGGEQASFATAYLGAYLRDIGVALAVVAGLFLLLRRRDRFFLARGQLDAPIAPVRWLGIRQGESWRTFGWIFGGIAALGVMIPTILGLELSADLLLRALPLLPAVLFFSAINALTEEIYFRASLLATLHRVIGRSQALGITVVYFGLAHYLYGSPSGIAGFLMTAFLAWLLGKSILETRGLFWAWLIHFLPDVVIFVSYALNWVR